MNERESGFSLVELMVAMTVTLIITGAIFGLLSGGQNAFRREPALSDRQQNIRMSMGLIMRDIATAGSAMPPFIQTFRPGLDGGTITACLDSAGAAVACPTAPSGAPVDELEMMANPNNFAPEVSCTYSGGSSSNVRLMAKRTRVSGDNVVMIIIAGLSGNDGHWTLRNINGGVNYPNPGSGDCVGGVDHANINFTNGGDPTGYNLAGGLCAGAWNGTQCGAAPGNACILPDLSPRSNAACIVKEVVQAEVVRYRIRLGSDGVPNLERFSSGGSSPANFGAGGVQKFQVIARGIDDLQVRYTAASLASTDNAPAVDQTQLNYGSVIHRVVVTLSSRSETRNVQGMTTAASGPAALRGTLSSEGTPRAALMTLGTTVTERKAGWTGPPQWN